MKIFQLLNSLGLALLMGTFCCQGSFAQTGGEDELSYRDRVQIMYVAYYGRPGDAGGLDFWAGELEEVNGNLMEIIDSFGNSMEFTERFGDLDDEELVNNIFLQLFGRDADSGGLNFYVNALREGRFTMASLALNVADGTQNLDEMIKTNKLRAANAFSEAYVEAGADYGEFQIDDAKLWLGEVDSTDASVTAALDRLPDLLEMFSGGTTPDPVVESPSTLSEGSVRVLYVAPADREFRDYHSHDISRAIVDVQSWYRRQLDGLSFDIYSVIPEQCHLSRDEEYYSHGDVWSKVLTDVQSCAPVQDGSSRFTWVLYVDASELGHCGEPHELGRGGDGLTMLPREDLELLQMPGTKVYCDIGAHYRTSESVIGGLAHELGHTFGLPHPPGCDEGLPSCDHGALMSNGYDTYPDTYLRDDERAILRRSPFIK